MTGRSQSFADPSSRGLHRRSTGQDLSPTQESRQFGSSLADSFRGKSKHHDNDPFLLTSSHVLQTPHNYNPDHAYKTRCAPSAPKSPCLPSMVHESRLPSSHILTGSPC